MHALLLRFSQRPISNLQVYALLLTWLMAPSIAMAQQAPHDSLRVQKMFEIGFEHLAQERLDSANHYFLQAGALSKKTGYHSGIAAHLRNRILVLDRRGKYQEALQLALEAVEISKKVGQSDLATSYNYAGNLYNHLGKLEAAASSYLAALKIAESLGNAKTQLKYGNNLASVFAQLGEKEKCFLYASKSYQVARQLKDTLGMTSSLSNMAYSQVSYKNYDSASRYYQETLQLSRKYPEQQLHAYHSLGEVEILRGNLHGALSYFQQGLQALHYFPLPKYEMFMVWGMSSAYFKLGMTAQAEYYFNKSVLLAQQIGVSMHLRDIYALGADIHEQLKNPQLALDFRKKYQHLNDSLLNAETQQNIHRMEIEYQTTQKEKEIAQQSLMLAQNNLEIEKKNNLIYLSLAAVIALISGIIIFYMYYRDKQKRNAQMMQVLWQENELRVLMAMIEGEEKERSRLARELHDGVGGMLSASKMHLSVLRNEADRAAQLQKFEHTASLLDAASREIRSIAHNLSPDMLLRYELDQALAHFCKSVSNDKLQVDFYYLGDSIRLKSNFKLALYRIVQELVNNIIKHAGASHALVQLSYHEQLLHLTVEDNGVGFEWHEGKGIGLANLKARVKDLHGELSLDSSPGSGTTVNAEFDPTPFLEKNPTEAAAV